MRWVLAALLLTMTSSAAAYVRATSMRSSAALRWVGQGCIELRLEAGGSTQVGELAWQAALAQAAQIWEQAIAGCSYLRFVIHPPAQLSEDGDNRDVRVLWVDRGWKHAPEMVALTSIRYMDQPGKAEDGTIVGAAIEVNGEGYRWATDGEPTALDLQFTLLHELGHVLGLDHPCQASSAPTLLDAGGVAVPGCDQRSLHETIMYPSTGLGDRTGRLPSTDEVAGVCSIYPRADDPGVCQAGTGCAVTPGPAGSAPAWLLIAGLAVIARRRR